MKITLRRLILELSLLLCTILKLIQFCSETAHAQQFIIYCQVKWEIFDSHPRENLLKKELVQYILEEEIKYSHL